MKPWAIELLACPLCRAPLSQVADLGGPLRCANCRGSYPIERGVPRFVKRDAYTSSFSFEWRVHARTQLDDATSLESEEMFRRKTGLERADVEGRTVLDVGCGMGRFSDVVSRWGGQVLACDLSLGVESALRNVGARPNVQVIQADLFQLPIRDASIDIVFSIGVLHHTPSTRHAFLALPRYLKPDGHLAVWVYHRGGMAQRVSDIYRRGTTRMPPRALYRLCSWLAPLYYVHRVPLLGSITRRVLPISEHPRPEWRLLDTFDWYSPRYQWKHTYPEVFRWFREAGLVDVELLNEPVSMRGRRPAAG